MGQKKEILLRNNRRAAGLLVAISAVPCLVGCGVMAWALSRSLPTWTILGGLIGAFGLYQFVRQLSWLVVPRLALSGNYVLVYLERLAPTRVPLDVVECFFIGQAPSRVRVAHPAGDRTENVTVVVRLAERAPEWHKQPVNPQLGRWCEGYITIYGDWCEPLNGDVVTQINHRLTEYKRHRRESPLSVTVS